MSDNEVLGKRLKDLRLERNYSVRELAKLLEVPPSTYQGWESGRTIKWNHFMKISKVFEMTATELMSDKKPNYQMILDEIKNIEQRLIMLKDMVAKDFIKE